MVHLTTLDSINTNGQGDSINKVYNQTVSIHENAARYSKFESETRG